MFNNNNFNQEERNHRYYTFNKEKDQLDIIIDWSDEEDIGNFLIDEQTVNNNIFDNKSILFKKERNDSSQIEYENDMNQEIWINQNNNENLQDFDSDILLAQEGTDFRLENWFRFIVPTYVKNDHDSLFTNQKYHWEDNINTINSNNNDDTNIYEHGQYIQCIKCNKSVSLDDLCLSEKPSWDYTCHQCEEKGYIKTYKFWIPNSNQFEE
eukprot:TRINITY_DN9576_c0_g1_i2.p1 TRINITY_DN9576_c0_g1~~TRINITY_DN9576_c0_g1_i2.p1  ORF type:complete len:210 (-),score=62.51 TRINITY_DN9576_c0_g1_i2:156-785(-)